MHLDQSCRFETLEHAVSGFDVVIARFDSSLRRIPSELARLRSYSSFSADTLVYWEWSKGRGDVHVAPPDNLTLTQQLDGRRLSRLVAAVFADYSNHYAANPLIDESLTGLGYQEWVATLRSSTDVMCEVLASQDGTYLGFSLVDYSTDVPDIKLAGMHPDMQGRGLYSHLIRGSLREAGRRGHEAVVISTQVDNIAVTRAWARLGLLPQHAFSTHHLVRRELLDASS